MYYLVTRLLLAKNSKCFVLCIKLFYTKMSFTIFINSIQNITDSQNLKNLALQKIVLLEMTDERSIHFKVTFSQLLFILIVLYSTLLVFIYMKFIVFKYFYLSGIDISDRPINGLIFLDQLTTTIGLVHYIINDCVLFLYPGFPGMIFQNYSTLNNYCWAYEFVHIFSLINYTTGSIGIIVYRLLYLSCQFFVKHSVGELNLLILLIINWFVCTLLMTIAAEYQTSSNSPIYNNCMGFSVEFHKTRLLKKKMHTN